MSLFKPGDLPTKYVIDYYAFQKAKRTLGVVSRVYIEPHEFDNFDGEYIPLERSHRIRYNPVRDRWTISETLWHELAHAMQCERDYGGDAWLYDLLTASYYKPLYDSDHQPRVKPGEPGYEDWLVEYKRIPMEAEAEEIALRYSVEMPLLKQRPRYHLLQGPHKAVV